jgi:hypothetical protein
MSKVNGSTRLIHVESERYPVYLQDVREANTNISFGMEADSEWLEEIGYAVVQESDTKPEGDVVTEGTPELVDGVWTRTWTSRPFDETELATQLSAKVAELEANLAALRRQDLLVGFPYQIDGQGDVFHVQLRVEDRVNLMFLHSKGEKQIAAGVEDTTVFRSYENKSHVLTPTQLVAMTERALMAMNDIYELSWALKDEIDAAKTVAELPELPDTLIS